MALRIAQWCSPKFEVQVDKWLEAYLRGELGAKRAPTFYTRTYIEVYMGVCIKYELVVHFNYTGGEEM